MRRGHGHPKMEKEQQFTNLAVQKGMKNEDYLGIMLKHDYFLNLMSDCPKEDIEAIWREMVGIRNPPPTKKGGVSSKVQGILRNAQNKTNNNLNKKVQLAESFKPQLSKVNSDDKL